MAELIILTVVFVFLSGLLALIDAAVLSVTRAEAEELVSRNAWGSSALKTITKRMTRAVVVLAIVTNTINILGPILIGEHAVNLFGSTAIGVVTALLAFTTIIFSEIIPKSLGTHYAPQVGRVVAPFVLALIYVLFPIVWLLERLVNLFKDGKRAIGTEEQIRALARIGHRAGYIRSSEGLIIHRAFILNDRTAADLMVPRDKVVSIAEASTVKEAAMQVFKHTYSRYPVIAASLDDVHGLVLGREILASLANDKGDDPVSGLIKEILTVDRGMRADKLLLMFRDRHIHLAVVRDGPRTLGIVTLEDVLEELVGEIEDEAD